MEADDIRTLRAKLRKIEGMREFTEALKKHNMKKKEDLKSIVCMAIADVKTGLLTPEDIEDNDRLQDGLGLDSLDFVELTMKLERRLKISIPDEEMGEYCNGTVSELVEYLQTKIK